MNFYFYDLETTGLDPFGDRIMQFGGQRVDENLEPLNEVEEFYVKLSGDILPTPGAILVHKILPQTVNVEGVSEYQFLQWLHKKVYKPKTIYAGYNSVHFDNRFLYYLHWRNFASQPPMFESPASLDIYHLACLAVDLRPQGLKWPPPDPVKKSPHLDLGALSTANKIKNLDSHRAAGDTVTTIALAKLFKKTQPKLLDHCLQLLKPKFVKKIISQTDQPFVYNHYSNLAFGSRTTLAAIVAEHPTRVGCYIVYDLRCDITPWQNLNAYQLSLALKKINLKPRTPTPFSVLDINKIPLVAPLSVLDKDSSRRLKLKKTQINKNFQALRKSNLAKLLPKAYLELTAKPRSTVSLEKTLAQTPISANDKLKRQQIYKAKPDKIANLNLEFDNPTFKHLQFLYQARNFPKSLTTEQIIAWEEYKTQIFLKGKPSGLNIFKRQVRRSLKQFKPENEAENTNLLEELQLYIESLLPEPA